MCQCAPRLSIFGRGGLVSFAPAWASPASLGMFPPRSSVPERKDLGAERPLAFSFLPNVQPDLIAHPIYVRNIFAASLPKHYAVPVTPPVQRLARYFTAHSRLHREQALQVTPLPASSQCIAASPLRIAYRAPRQFSAAHGKHSLDG